MIAYIPNLITIFRLFLVIPIVYLLLEGHHKVALILFVIAGISDGVDGAIARKFKWKSWFGSMLDPVADKLLLTSCFFTLYWVGILSGVALSILVFRDLFIVAGAAIYHYLYGKYEFQPTFISKINTFIQLSFILAILLNLSFELVPLYWLWVLLWIMLTTTVLSLIDYVWTWSWRAYRNKYQNQDL